MHEEALNLWFRLRIDDPHLASSESFSSLLRRILKRNTVAFAAIERFEGVRRSNQPTSQLEEPFVVLAAEGLIEQLGLYTQLIWGRFFLLKDPAGVKPNSNIEQKVRASEATVCVADNTSYFVFTESSSLVDDLLSNYGDCALSNGNLSDLLALPEEL
jgi:hypothetical protein